MGSLAVEDPPSTNGSTTPKDLGDSHPIPAPEPFVSFNALKDRIKYHYDAASDYYYSLWGEHIHHGYFTEPNDTKEVAQRRLITLLLEKSALPAGSTVLDVGCGIGGTSRYLAREKGCKVTGITISGKQVEIAGKLTAEAAQEQQGDGNLSNGDVTNGTASSESGVSLGKGSVKFIELDAEKMGQHFEGEQFDCVWISEAMSHLPNKELFFQNAFKLLRPGGKLVVADWLKREDCSEAEMENDIKLIEGEQVRFSLFHSVLELTPTDGMLLPPLCAPSDYVNFAKGAGLNVFSEAFDISKEVAKTW
jgi:tocopherol O-methyltransferase